MDQPVCLATPMELLFQTLSRMLHAKFDSRPVEDTLAPGAQVVAGLVEMLRGQGVYDPAQPVESVGLPLVHALAQHKDLPVEWLDFFATHAPENRLFEAVNGNDIGAVMFDRMMKAPGSLHSPAMEWWIQNAPSIPAEQGSKWMERLSKRKSDAIYSALGRHSDDMVQKFTKLLLGRGSTLKKEEPGRPQERWLRQQVWWETVSAQGRMGEVVRAPSGTQRTLDEMLQLGQVGGAYGRWKNGEYPRDDMQAPHGRKKDLMDLWVLHSAKTPVAERAKRLAVAMQKSEGVGDELWVRAQPPKPRKTDHRPLLRQVMEHRTPSGMSMAGWFMLHQGGWHEWPSVDKALFGRTPEQAVEATIAPDGAGLLLQGVRAAVGSGQGELPGWSHGCMQLKPMMSMHPSLAKAVSGDPSTHGELVDLLVDTLVCPSPCAFSCQVAEFVLAQDIVDQEQADRLRQAFSMSGLARLARSIKRASDAAHRASQNPKKNYYASSHNQSLDTAKKTATALLGDLNAQGCLLSMTARDWETLFVEWGLTPRTTSILGQDFNDLFKQLRTQLRGHGERLALAEQTVVARPTMSQPRPRL